MRISQRPEPILERFGRPDVVAIEADVFPAERADVGEQRVGQNFALGAKLGGLSHRTRDPFVPW